MDAERTPFAAVMIGWPRCPAPLGERTGCLLQKRKNSDVKLGARIRRGSASDDNDPTRLGMRRSGSYDTQGIPEGTGA
jgi:hypothetical protein